MKYFILVVLCFAASRVFSQTSETVFQEKSSDWVNVSSPVTESRPRAATIKRKKSHKRTAASKQDVQEEFEKTNSQVNRFKKKS